VLESLQSVEPEGYKTFEQLQIVKVIKSLGREIEDLSEEAAEVEREIHNVEMAT